MDNIKTTEENYNKYVEMIKKHKIFEWVWVQDYFGQILSEEIFRMLKKLGVKEGEEYAFVNKKRVSSCFIGDIFHDILTITYYKGETIYGTGSFIIEEDKFHFHITYKEKGHKDEFTNWTDLQTINWDTLTNIYNYLRITVNARNK